MENMHMSRHLIILTRLSSLVTAFIPGSDPGVIKNIWELKDIRLPLVSTTQLSKLLVYNVASGNSLWRNKVNRSFNTTCVVTNLMCTSCRNKNDITRVLEHSKIMTMMLDLQKNVE